MRRVLWDFVLFLFLVAFILSSASTATAAPFTIAGVSEHTSTYGCAPTAAATLLSYYGLPVDIGLLAAAMGTTGSGATNVMDVAPGIERYTQGKLTATTLDYREFSYSGNSAWLNYTNEIDAGRPVLMSVDSNGDWNCDHAVTAIGYDDRGTNGLYYGFYTGWEDTERIQWERFAWSVFNTESWGIGFGTFVSLPVMLATQSVPEPASILLVGAGLFFIGIVPNQIQRRSHV
jgi:hypothetical protein